MTFTAHELAYLRSQPLARLSTVAPDGQPDVVPVAFEFDGTYFWVGGGGVSVLATRKFRNVPEGGEAQVALVVDDLPSFDPFTARGLRVYGIAAGPFERTGAMGPGHFLRITPTRSWGWNLEGEKPVPVGDTWYEARYAEHARPSA
ncbi:PPOX class F420-dependent oxidoreductase [Streptomyces spiroverticillatus]|uniref:PPOX class F420-dependent oxidoreductase n=1 Tax=Streptomyces finlayi TaxID=67296 RepID=A0A918WTH0_9ACTN|nr:PPOX class F420-dependent oxidoreductase [Streptomyces finlayi]GGZ90200.1 PPOX class F420-dependent oxidoreductase [Streptomyces spiroverticillatus]GHC81055.1 PPOX class F420-dependent oxidoreductase [Streptomyces finlayi]